MQAEDLKLLIIGFLILLINLIGYILIWYDKRSAKRDGWRIPEKRFFRLAFFGGAIGIYLGMKKFRHKTKHNKFIYGIPVLILSNIGLFYLIYSYIN